MPSKTICYFLSFPYLPYINIPSLHVKDTYITDLKMLLVQLIYSLLRFDSIIQIDYHKDKQADFHELYFNVLTLFM